MKPIIALPCLLLYLLLVVSCEEPVEIELPEESSVTNPEQLAQEELPLAIFSSVCYKDGEVLTVYNPKTQDFKAYTGKDFQVKWSSNEILIEKGAVTHCICSKIVKVVVKEISTGINSTLNYTTRKCKDE